MQRYPRDFRGHGENPPNADWPGGAKIAISLVLNYEEGGENCLLHGDAQSEGFLSDIAGAQPWPGMRHWNMESIYEYGARAGFWRLHRLFTGAGIPVTVYGVATALARNPEQVAAMRKADWEIASHGLKWIEHRDMDEAEEARQIAETFRLHEEVVGEPPLGWYTGRCSVNTVRLTAETRKLVWISDTYDDDLPYWLEVGDHDQLVIPYTLETNDMRFASAPGYVTGEDFFTYLKDTFDTLYAEGMAGQAKMFSIGLHNRLIGRAGRFAGLKRFIDYTTGHDGVWFARRSDIAAHWRQHHPHHRIERPSRMDRAQFLAAFGDSWPGTPWVAEQAFELELGPAHDCAIGMANALARAFRRADEGTRLTVLGQLPDLLKEDLTLPADDPVRRVMAAIAGLRPADHAAFSQQARAYAARHGLPLILAPDAASAPLQALGAYADHDRADALSAATDALEQIVAARLKGFLP